MCGWSRYDGRVLQPFSQHKVLQLQQVFLVLGGLLQPLVVDVGQVVGAIQELLVVQRIVPVLRKGDIKFDSAKIWIYFIEGKEIFSTISVLGFFKTL